MIALRNHFGLGWGIAIALGLALASWGIADQTADPAASPAPGEGSARLAARAQVCLEGGLCCASQCWCDDGSGNGCIRVCGSTCADGGGPCHCDENGDCAGSTWSAADCSVEAGQCRATDYFQVQCSEFQPSPASPAG